MATSAQTAAPSSGTAASVPVQKSTSSTPKVTRPAAAKAAPTVRKATAVAKTSTSTAKPKAKVAAKPAVKPANKVAAAPVRKASGAPAVKPSKKVVAASSTAKSVAKTGASTSRKPAATSLAAKPAAKPAVKSPVRPVVAAGKVPAKAKSTAAASPRVVRPKASAVVAGSSTKPDRTPSPPATLSQKKPVASGAAKVVSAEAGKIVTTSLSRPQSKPPFSPDDDEAVVEETSSDGFELAEKEAEGSEAQAKQESLIVGRPAGALEIEMSSPSQTPMVSLFGMAGGAGAAAMNADPLNPTAGGREAMSDGPESTVGEPVALPPSESSRSADLPEPSASDAAKAPDVSASSAAQPQAAAAAEGAVSEKITFSSSEDEFSAAPSPVEITTPMSSQESVLTASSSVPDEVPALSAPPVETTSAPLRGETASIAGAEPLVVAEQLDEPVAPTAVAAALDAVAVGEGTSGTGRVRATVSSLEREVWPVGGEGVNPVVATSLQAGGALGSDVDGAPSEAEVAPVRMALPPAPDQLAPQRAERSGAAFEVPAAAGDLVIAANTQTDFEVEEKRVVFSGSVIMKNERFHLTADTLVAHLKDNQSGLDFAEAQGNVVVRMVENGRETGSSGLAKSAIFRPETGEIVLKGWPQLRMGNKAHVASAATTEMSLFTDGRMKTSGRNQTMIVP